MGSKLPFFSIIIPTHERPGQVAVCLKALAHLEYPRERFEVIVVDDGSQRPLESVIAPFRRQLELLFIKQDKAGPGAARNTGAACAKGMFLVFTDDDCVPAFDWLQTLAARFDVLPDRIIGGRVLNASSDNFYAVASQLMHDAVYAYFNADPYQAHFLASNNLAVPTDRFLALGGFDTTLPLAAGEDNELCDRWRQQGYRMAYAPEVLVYHAQLSTFHSFWRQHFNRGRAAFHYRQMRPSRGWGRCKTDPKFYLHLFSYPFRRIHSVSVLLFEALLLMSHVAKSAGFLSEKVNRKVI